VHPLGRALICDRCHVQLRNAVYELRAEQERIVRCLRCALLYRPMLRRSLVIAIIVGTILTAINQGNIIAQGDLPLILAWKIPLTYCVPFCVATTGAILNARSAFSRSD
jgi:hypothetical protein